MPDQKKDGKGNGDTRKGRGAIVLLPCNGLSARGRVAHRAAIMIEEGMEQVGWVDVVPLMAGLSTETQRLREAGYIMGLSGCEYRCDAEACRKSIGRDPNDSFVVGDLVAPDVKEVRDLPEEDLKRAALETSSRVIGILTKV